MENIQHNRQTHSIVYMTSVFCTHVVFVYVYDGEMLTSQISVCIHLRDGLQEEQMSSASFFPSLFGSLHWTTSVCRGAHPHIFLQFLLFLPVWSFSFRFQANEVRNVLAASY